MPRCNPPRSSRGDLPFQNILANWNWAAVPVEEMTDARTCDMHFLTANAHPFVDGMTQAIEDAIAASNNADLFDGNGNMVVSGNLMKRQVALRCLRSVQKIFATLRRQTFRQFEVILGIPQFRSFPVLGGHCIVNNLGHNDALVSAGVMLSELNELINDAFEEFSKLPTQHGFVPYDDFNYILLGLLLEWFVHYGDWHGANAGI